MSISMSSLVAQWVKNPALSLHWFELPPWHGFGPWPRNFHMLWAWPKKTPKDKIDAIKGSMIEGCGGESGWKKKRRQFEETS